MTKLGHALIDTRDDTVVEQDRRYLVDARGEKQVLEIDSGDLEPTDSPDDEAVDLYRAQGDNSDAEKGKRRAVLLHQLSHRPAGNGNAPGPLRKTKAAGQEQ